MTPKVDRSTRAAAKEMCAICGLQEGLRGCRCDAFPMAMPHGIAYGDVIMAAGTEVVALYFVPAGSDKRVPKHLKPGRRSGKRYAPTAADGIAVIKVTDTHGNVNLKQWQLVAPSEVELVTHVDMSGRRVRKPSRYEPERLAASRMISTEQRQACFNRTLTGEHRCFCCLSLLCFTMEEEFTINTDQNTLDADKVRCHEAGHVLAHSRGKPVIGDEVDEIWNLIPLCHSCNVRMGRQNAFTFINKTDAAHLAHPSYQQAEALFNSKCPLELRD